MQHLTLVYSAPRPAPCEPASRDRRFSSRDRMALDEWVRRADAHGYRRVLVEDGSHEDGPEHGAYVLLYAPDNAWARWGIARREDGITVWHCGTGADLGGFATMNEALDSLPPVRPSTLRAAPKPSATMPRFSLVHSA